MLRGERAANVAVAPLWPALLSLLLALVIARTFATVYECTIDTIFVCAMRDKDEYGSTHMSESLREALCLEPSAEHAEARDEGGQSAPQGKVPLL